MSHADNKRVSRRAVHDQFCVPALFSHSSLDEAVTLCVRYHTRLDRGGMGALESGYAAVLEGITRLVFDEEELAVKGLSALASDSTFHNAVVFFPDYNLRFSLDTLDPRDGPITVTWTVVPIG